MFSSITDPMSRSGRIRRTGRVALQIALAASVAVLGASAPAGAQTCTPTWDPGASPRIGNPGPDFYVSTMAVFDDGSGPTMYAGGVTGSGSIRFAEWNGASWATLLFGPATKVFALTVFDDGTGPALFVGGHFMYNGNLTMHNIAKWDGSSWSTVGGGLGGWNSEVHALAVFDDGTGPALYAGGAFALWDGAPADFIAKWDGASWTPVGSGLDGSVDSLAVFDDGTGPALYAGGSFQFAGGAQVNYIAKWDGSTWSSLGNGANWCCINALTVFDDGTGPALYAGGTFSFIGSVNASRIAKWDGAAWSPLGNGISGVFSIPIEVNALTVFDDGTGPALYTGGNFLTAGGGPANFIAKWDGSSWSPVGSGMDQPVDALAVLDDGTGPALYAGGAFNTAGGFFSRYIARYTGCPTTVSPADFNGDGVVNAADLATLLGQWGPCPAPPASCVADLNGDGVVNASDLATLLGSWG